MRYEHLFLLATLEFLLPGNEIPVLKPNFTFLRKTPLKLPRCGEKVNNSLFNAFFLYANSSQNRLKMDSIPASDILDYIDLVNNQTNTSFFIYNIDDHKVEIINGKFDELVGKKLDEVQTNFESALQLVHPDDRDFVINTILSMKENKEKKNFEFRIVNEETEKWVCLTAIPKINKNNQTLVAGTLEDITLSKNNRFILDKYNSKKDATLNILSHDLAAPFNNIKQIAELLDNRLKKYDEPEITKLIEYIKMSSKKGTDLIQDFVAQEFLESSESDVVKKRIDIVQKIKIIAEDYKNSEDIIQKTFNFYYSDSVILVSIDDMKFMQVLNNIYLNAIKFTPEKGVINTRVEKKEDSVLISIEDNGIGIPEKLQPFIFEKFTKARRPGLKGERTTGLGLSLAKLIVDWHKGKIWFTSAENKGTTFFVEIPIE
jgi:two-component system, OmpR family, sensor histidine kinase VicK